MCVTTRTGRKWCVKNVIMSEFVVFLICLVVGEGGRAVF